ncbi:transcriptional regulator [Jannaschia pagri]|uniref:Transcriptional regulator n=1 Tax=Jannaschia pagri TaxID=2829797 RepID=A0ABQ4NI92_9RHOB|nr:MULTISPECIES: Lrp/AsnC family transcriptional regulator [unclassified Jannaschia]GIT89979.1 transcriptional regulator [Jannaschia sp. AI_61]GIT93915.1 transcriptional regulator [Jannaschia sp. AI_62]
MDPTDRALLQALQRDATQSSETLGRILNLSASQASRRRARLEREGVIRATVARLDGPSLGLQVQAFVQVQMASHAPKEARAFLQRMEAEPRVTSVWTLTGEADYLLRVWCTDLAQLNDLVHRVLLPHSAVARVQSQIVMDQPKRDSPLPV